MFSQVCLSVKGGQISCPISFRGGVISDTRSFQGGGYVQGMGTHPQDTMGYGQQVGGTHPTGMLPCS